MAETNDTYRTPEIAPTKLEGGTYVALHEGSPDLIPHENIRLAREAMNLAVSSADEEPVVRSPERDIPTPAQLQGIGNAVTDLRADKLAGQLTSFEEDKAA